MMRKMGWESRYGGKNVGMGTGSSSETVNGVISVGIGVGFFCGGGRWGG